MWTSDFWPKYAATMDSVESSKWGIWANTDWSAEEQDAVSEADELVDLAGEDHDAHAFLR